MIRKRREANTRWAHITTRGIWKMLFGRSASSWTNTTEAAVVSVLEEWFSALSFQWDKFVLLATNGAPLRLVSKRRLQNDCGPSFRNLLLQCSLCLEGKKTLWTKLVQTYDVMIIVWRSRSNLLMSAKSPPVCLSWDGFHSAEWNNVPHWGAIVLSLRRGHLCSANRFFYNWDVNDKV